MTWCQSVEAIELTRRSAKICWGSIAEDTAWSVVEFDAHVVEVGLIVG